MYTLNIYSFVNYISIMLGGKPKGNLQGLRFGNVFLNTIPKIQTTEEKLDQLNLKFLCIKGHYQDIKRVKKQPTEWKEIFANHIQVSSLCPSIKVSFMPLCFYEITTSLPIFANGKKSKEDFHFYGERGKAKIMFTTCFAASH